MTMTHNFAEIDFTDAKAYDDPYEMYAWLRSLDTLHYDALNDLYIAARYEDVFHISRNHETYCSGEGVRPKIAGEMSLITLDGDEHLRQRRLINQGFTPRQVRELIPHVRELTNQTVDQIADRGEIDFVEDFAIHVPLIIICELMGLDPEQRLKMYRWSDAMMDGDGHVEADDPVLLAAAEAFGEYATMVIELIADRRAAAESGGELADDLITTLTQAFDDGGLARNADKNAIQGVDEAEYEKMQIARGQLDDEDLISFLVILLVAGNETTRNAISGGMLALSRFPEQKKLLLDNLFDDEFMDIAVEEIIRFVSPVLTFIRTVTEDHTYRGTELKKGDRVLMIYSSANRDPEAIDRPDELDLTRQSDHLAFGIGKHYCLGANLARMEVKIVFQELLTRLPDIEIPEGTVVPRGDSSLVLALQNMPATFTKCPVAH